MLKLMHALALRLLLIATSFDSKLHAQTASQELRVVTRVLQPMVIDQQGQLSGFSIELWNTISERLNAKTTYQTAPNVAALLEEIRLGRADAGVSAISITSSRRVPFPSDLETGCERRPECIDKFESVAGQGR